ncbi:MAG: type III polyketide synthase [Bradymonadia bacterium]
MYIAAAGTALPPHRYDQEALIDAFKSQWQGVHHNVERLAAIHRNALVGGRNLALPMEAYLDLDFERANQAYIDVAVPLGAEALEQALSRAGVSPEQVDVLCFVTVTGLAVPSIDARLMNRLPLRADLKRMPLFGLGCVAGAAGLARVSDALKPGQVGALLSVELCSLTLQRGDFSLENIVASGLFGDGAAAVVVRADGEAPRGLPEIVDTRSIFFPDTERVMGWDFGSGGFKVVLSAQVPHIARDSLRPGVEAFLGAHGLSIDDIERFVCHPGGPKVLEGVADGLELPDGALDASWASLRTVGNLSSASVLMVMSQTLDEPPPPGSWGLLMAMGPGFCAELVLLRWLT